MRQNFGFLGVKTHPSCPRRRTASSTGRPTSVSPVAVRRCCGGTRWLGRLDPSGCRPAAIKAGRRLATDEITFIAKERSGRSFVHQARGHAAG